MDKGCTICFTGLSGSGKTTWSKNIEKYIECMERSVKILDRYQIYKKNKKRR